MGLGFGAGRAWEEADGMFLCYNIVRGREGILTEYAIAAFKRGGSPTDKDGVRLVRS